MEQLPLYINVVFILTTFMAAGLLYKAAGYSKVLIILTLSWLALQTAMGLSGFYTITNTVPPRFALLLIPPVAVLVIMFMISTGRIFIDSLNIKTLTLLHIVRVPVELTLYWLFLHKAVPQVMTFEGRNFDILCGLTAPFVYYFGYVRPILSSKIIIAWNVLCLLLLANIVVTAVLSAPFPFQKFGFNHPNIALFYFPFVWLPGFVVPAALFSHLVVLRKLLKKGAA